MVGVGRDLCGSSSSFYYSVSSCITLDKMRKIISDILVIANVCLEILLQLM